MAKACRRAADSQVLRENPTFTFHLGPYAYELTYVEGRNTLSVTDGARSDSVALGWEFGEGETGETYVFERDRIFYEAKLSYFPTLHALDITPGQQRSTPPDLERALGRPMDPEEARLCFGCHNTASSASGQFDPDHLIPGVTCEACHGPGAGHIRAMKDGKVAEGLARILNPAKLDPADSVDFCGACHRAWADVMETGMVGITTVRFQPYRLEKSRCWGEGNARITCLACHDPHQPLAHDPGSYDSRCLRCHAAGQGLPPTRDHPGAACPVGTSHCVQCHMPKYEVPGTHARFTDHWIRIVRSEARYPE